MTDPRAAQWAIYGTAPVMVPPKGTMARDWAVLYVRCRQLGRAVVAALPAWLWR